MRVLPILFNTDMVCAILDGRKTVTRRICKDGNEYTVPDMGYYDSDKRTYAVHNYCDKRCTYEYQISTSERKCPICPGDILYVRETWNHYRYTNLVSGEHREGYFYKASPEIKDTLPNYVQYYWGQKWRPSIHMPKEAARIFLKVNDVRVERLQEITEDDVLKEGIHYDECPAGFTWKKRTSIVDCYTSAIGAFSHLWNVTIKTDDIECYSWEVNPWVWVIEFERCEKPESFLAEIGKE